MSRTDRRRSRRTHETAKKEESGEKDEPGRFAYDGLDRTIHERARLSILASLAAHGEELTFNDLKDLCQLTDGNLSRHLAILEEAGLVAVRKGFHGNRPQTTVSLTTAGRRRFSDYLVVLESIVRDAQEGHQAVTRSSRRASDRLSPA